MEQLREELTEMKVQIGLLMVDMQATVRRQKLLEGENTDLKVQLNAIIKGGNLTPVVSPKANAALHPVTDGVFSTSQPIKTPANHGIHFGSLLPTEIFKSSQQQIVIPSQDKSGVEIRQQRGKEQEEEFKQIPMLYAQLLPRLLELQLIRVRPAKPSTVFSCSKDIKSQCDFHPGNTDHDTENCRVLKHIVRDLLKLGIFTFTPDGQNIQIHFVPATTNEGKYVTQGSTSDFNFLKSRSGTKRKKQKLRRNRYHPFFPLTRKGIPEYDPIPMPHGQLLTRLLELHLVELQAPPPATTWVREEHKKKVCEYHSGSSRHSIEECREFRNKVQELVKSKIIVFVTREDGGPITVQCPSKPEMIPTATSLRPSFKLSSGKIVQMGHVNVIDVAESSHLASTKIVESHQD